MYYKMTVAMCLVLTMQSVLAQQWSADAVENMFGERDYSLWRNYEQTEMSDMKPQVWRNKEDIIDGWDWSLPPAVKPSENGLLCVRRLFNPNRSLKGKLPKVPASVTPVVSLWVKWKYIEKTEDEFNFEHIKQRMQEAEDAGYGVILRIHSSATRFAPEWIKKYNIPHRTEHKPSSIVNYDVSHPEFHRRYLRLVEELGNSGIPQNPTLKAAYVGYASPSNGDEGIGPEDQNPDTIPHVRERLDAWARAFKGIEHKVFMGGNSTYGYSLGFGGRRGFVEMYLYSVPEKFAGQTLDNDGYLLVDESAPLIANNCFHGEENEEYDRAWLTAERGFRFGKSDDSYTYRYFTANLRLLQMRCNYVLNNEFTLLPEQLTWVGQSLGKTIDDTPDVWCTLRESYLAEYKYNKLHGKNAPVGVLKNGLPVKNFERWMYQRDSQGAQTTPTVKISHPIKMWMVKEGRHYDYIARSGKRIGFAVDDRWLKNEPHDVAIKISYFDCGTSAIRVHAKTSDGDVCKIVPLINTGKLKTATLFVKNFVDRAQGMEYDITLENQQENVVVSFIRVIKR